MNPKFEVLVIARPSRFRDSLHLLLASISAIDKNHLADDLETAIKMNKALAVVVVDADVAVGNGGLPVTIKRIKIAWPLACLIILVEDELEYQAAETAGVDVLLLKGFPADRFIAAVEQVVPKPTLTITNETKADE